MENPQSDRTAAVPDPARLIMALNHPLRRRILRSAAKEDIISASRLSKNLDAPLSNAVYHVQVLVELAIFDFVGSRQVRGAREHLYRSDLVEQVQWVEAALEASRDKDELMHERSKALRSY